jgi:hypothetical protein
MTILSRVTFGFGVIGAVMLCAAAESQSDATSSADEHLPAVLLAKRLPAVTLDDSNLEAAIDSLRLQSGGNILVNWKAIDAGMIDHRAPVHYKARNVSLMEAFLGIERSANSKLALYPTHGALLVTTKEDFKNPRGWVGLTRLPNTKNASDEKIVAALHKKIPEAKFDRVELSDAFDFLQDPKVLAIPIEVDWPALVAGGVDRKETIDLILKDVLGSDLVFWVLHRVDAKEPIGYQVRDGKLLVSTLAVLMMKSP